MCSSRRSWTEISICSFDRRAPSRLAATRRGARSGRFHFQRRLSHLPLQLTKLPQCGVPAEDSKPGKHMESDAEPVPNHEEQQSVEDVEAKPNHKRPAMPPVCEESERRDNQRHEQRERKCNHFDNRNRGSVEF